MSSLTLTIGGVDFMPRHKNNSDQISSQIQNQGDSLTMQLVIKSGQALPKAGQEIIYKDGTRYLFAGYVTSLLPTETGPGQKIVYDLEANDYTYLFVNKKGQASYENQTLAFIVNDLMTAGMDTGYGISTAGVATGPVIPSISFNHIPLRQCFEKIAKRTNYIWWIDYQKVLHFIDPNTAETSPEKLTDASANMEEGVQIKADVTQVRNEITVMGGTDESSNFPDIFLGDANTRGWLLTNAVTTMVTIELDTGSGYVSKVYGAEGKDDESVCYFMYTAARGSFRMAATAPTPAVGDKIRVTYTYPLPVMVAVQDPGSIVIMKGLEGGDGIHAYTINDTSIKSQSEARKRAMQELAAFSLPIIQGVVDTRTDLLLAGSYFSPGQALTVNFPSHGINQDTIYIIQKVVTTLTEGLTGIIYHYQITFGGRMLGVTDFLLALATPESQDDTDVSIQKIFAVSDKAIITELIVRNAGLRPIVDQINFTDAYTIVKVTPPFKWAPYGTANKARWNEFEWG